jgi:hypothetical protein
MDEYRRRSRRYEDDDDDRPRRRYRDDDDFDDDQPRKKKKKRRSKAGLFIGLFLFLLLLGGGAVVLILFVFKKGAPAYPADNEWTTFPKQKAQDPLNPSADLKEAMTDADRLDPGWRLADLEKNRKVPKGSNSADLISKTGKLLPRDWDLGLDSVFKREPRPDEALSKSERMTLRNVLDMHAAAIAEARTLAQAPEGRFKIVYSRDLINSPLPHLQDTRMVVTLLDTYACSRAEEGDGDAAVASCLAMLNARRALVDEPTAISQLVRVACFAIAHHSLERMLASSKSVSEKGLFALQKALEEADDNVMLIAMRGERAMSHGLIAGLANGDVQLSDVHKDFKGGEKEDKYKRDIIAGHAWLLKHMNHVVEAAKLPTEQQLARVNKLAAEIDAGQASKFLIPAYVKLGLSSLRNHAYVRTTMVGVAVERYRLANNRWPDKLEDLVAAGLLKEVPLDPFSGARLKMSVQPQGFVVYSVGQGRDYGGRWNNLNWQREINNTDFGFRVTAVEKRH